MNPWNFCARPGSNGPQGGHHRSPHAPLANAPVPSWMLLPSHRQLTESRFRGAVLKRFPVGSSRTEVEAKIRALVSPYGVTRDRRREMLNLYNRERHIHCELAQNFGFIGCSFFSDPKRASRGLWTTASRRAASGTGISRAEGGTPGAICRPPMPGSRAPTARNARAHAFRRHHATIRKALAVSVTVG